MLLRTAFLRWLRYRYLIISHLKNTNIDEEEHENEYEVRRRYSASYSSSSSFSLSKPNSFVVGLVKMLIWPPERLRYALCSLRIMFRYPRIPGTFSVPGSTDRFWYPWPPVSLWQFDCQFSWEPDKLVCPVVFYSSP